MLSVLLSLHVLFAVFWFGSVLFSDFVLIPSLQATPPETQSRFVESFAPRLNRALIPAGALTILSGVAVGIAFGVLSRLGSAYGRDWLAAFAVAAFTYLWGLLVMTPAAEKLRRLPPDSPDVLGQTHRIKTLGMLELLGFLVVFVLMMRMRFGG